MPTATILDYVDSLEEELIAIRRDLHQHPELLFDVFRTSAKVAELLEEWGLEVRCHVGRHFGMGVVGTLRGSGEGKTVLLRADMDALPIGEQNEAEYKSKLPGVMHACGHNVHTTMLLGAAKALSRYKEELRGTVKFVFQPAEEGAKPSPMDGRLLSGAPDMIEDGILEGTDVCFALHVWPDLPIGTLGVHTKYVMAASSHFTVQFHGVTGHHSTPHQAVRFRMGTALINDPLAVQHVLKAGAEVLGEEHTFVLEKPSLAGEDFVLYADQVPGAYAFIGVRNEDKGIIHSLHHPQFDVDEKVLVHGAKLHVQLVKQTQWGEG